MGKYGHALDPGGILRTDRKPSNFYSWAGGSKQEKGMWDSIFELKSLIRRQRMGSNSAGNPKIPGSLTDRVTKTLIYGKQEKSDTDMRIGGVKKALIGSAKQVSSRNQWGEAI